MRQLQAPRKGGDFMENASERGVSINHPFLGAADTSNKYLWSFPGHRVLHVLSFQRNARRRRVPRVLSAADWVPDMHHLLDDLFELLLPHFWDLRAPTRRARNGGALWAGPCISLVGVFQKVLGIPHYHQACLLTFDHDVFLESKVDDFG